MIIVNRVVPTWLTIQEKFDKLWGYEIRLMQRQDEWKHWRLWLKRSSPTDYEYIVEKPTIEECLDRAIEYIEKWIV